MASAETPPTLGNHNHNHSEQQQPPPPQAHHGHHSHHHHQGGGGGACCHNHNIEMTTNTTIAAAAAPPISIDELVNAPTQDVARALSTLLRFNRFEAFQPVLEEWKDRQHQNNNGNHRLLELLQQPDEGGHSLIHWAAKRTDDLRFLSTLIAFGNMATTTTTNQDDSSVSVDDASSSLSLLNVASQDNVGMRPLHWACTEGSIPHIALLLQHGRGNRGNRGVDNNSMMMMMMEAKDASGCTPLLIAAQYGQVHVVAYLLQMGANLQAVDTSKDSALHWAAYKGSIQVCGLLSYYSNSNDNGNSNSNSNSRTTNNNNNNNHCLEWTTQDTYGQTPLHLAALRGHTSVVRYCLTQFQIQANHNRTTNHHHRNNNKKLLHDLLFCQDKNDRTPLDLAIHKNRPNVQIVLREAMAAAEDPRGHFLRKTLWTNLQEMTQLATWKSWMGLANNNNANGMNDEMEAPSRFPYYFVIFTFCVHLVLLTTVFAPFANPGSGILWDLSGWLFWNTLCMLSCWYLFYKTVTTPPGFLDATHSKIDMWHRLYEETLEAYAATDVDDTQYADILADRVRTVLTVVYLHAHIYIYLYIYIV